MSAALWNAIDTGRVAETRLLLAALSAPGLLAGTAVLLASLTVGEADETRLRNLKTAIAVIGSITDGRQKVLGLVTRVLSQLGEGEGIGGCSQRGVHEGDPEGSSVEEQAAYSYLRRWQLERELSVLVTALADR